MPNPSVERTSKSSLRSVLAAAHLAHAARRMHCAVGFHAATRRSIMTAPDGHWIRCRKAEVQSAAPQLHVFYWRHL